MSETTDRAREHWGIAWPLLANLLAVLLLFVAFVLEESNRETYYLAIQEDEFGDDIGTTIFESGP